MTPLLRCIVLLAAFWVGGASPGVASAEEITYFTVTEFVVTGDNPLTQPETHAILAPYLGEQAGLLGLQNAAAALEQAMRARGHQFHRVVIPPQRARGRFELRALEFRVGAVEVEGNQHFDDANIRAMLPSLRPGTTPNSRALAREVQRANRHPSKRLALTMKRGAGEDEIDTLISVRDQSPHTLFLALNNRGSRETGKERLSLGYQYSNLFGLDHTATLSYTTAPGKWGDVRQYGASYRIPFYRQASSLTLLASHSDVSSGTVAEFFDVTGRGTVLGATWRHSLLNVGRYNHRVQLQLLDKAFDNDIDFLGQPIGADVRSRPVSLRYEGEWVLDEANAGFHLGWHRNLKWGPDNDRESYEASRTGASPGWSTFTAGGFVDRRLTGAWLLRGRLEGQYADEPLISGEQFGLGGTGSVRGFLQRATSVDDGVSAALELWMPPPHPTLQVLTFVDGGLGRRRNTQLGEVRRVELASAGLGLRWQPVDWLRVVLDWAVVLDGFGTVDAGDHRLHFNLSAVF
ncbi:MAG: ShlB/FhaC/HecB family hemolysin secretion/activation protein [Gammaproteobacteria bacterium]|nr:ShlB/FhaC/HecB family hemolysin secretion/activation protein [Gammaproteobacteria bacterium]